MNPVPPYTGHRTVTRLATRQLRRPALAVVGVTVGMSVLVVNTYARTVGDATAAQALDALAGNPAIRTLFGEPVALDTAGGFTVWRTGTVLAVLLTTWGALAAVRVTRGEEESGRWDLLLAGRLTPAALLGRHLAVLAAVMALTGILLGGALTAAGTPRAGAVLHATGLALAGLFAVAVAACAAQVFPTRAGASGASLAFLGVGLLTRMIGDGVPGMAGLRWLPPYGPLAVTRPYRDDHWAPLLVLAPAAVVLGCAALILASRRDVRAGLLRPPAGRAPRRWLLGSVGAFSVRRMMRPLAGWSTGIGVYFLLIGLLSDSLTGFLSDNPRFAELAAQAGFAGLGTARGYTATLFALLAIPIGAFATARLAAFAGAESAGRLTLLHAGLLPRARLLTAEVVTTVAGTAVLATVAALATWIGVQLAGAELPLAAALAGTANVLPVALLGAAAATLALGLAPRAVATIGMLPTAGGFLLKVTADSVHAPVSVGWLTPYAHLAAVPATPPNWVATATMLAVALAVAGVGIWAYHRRDLRL
ncbi:hypothetical protein [Micromonospora lupini]|uniref:hypothetical protein n=1 Tax=Micromonospora lupini TaxID=285679 RepID=UPI0033E27AC0